MSQILQAFQNLMTSRRHKRSNGWIDIDCPACGDRRSRGGMKMTASGGFRFSCFNGGCQYNIQPTGWEPGNGFNGRVRELFEILGGNIRDIPLKEVMRQKQSIYDRHGNVVGQEKVLEVVNKFPEVSMPKGTDLLEDAMEYDERALRVMEYLNHRSPMYLECDFPFMWSSSHPTYLLVPYLHFDDKIVGYMGRNIESSSGDDRFIQRTGADYMFNQHILYRGSGKYVFVVESPLEAILLRGVATRSNKITEKQANLLKMCGRIPVIIPDQIKDESGPFIEVAKANGWPVAVPSWPGKDAGDSITRMGLLWTIEAITSSMTTNYNEALIRLGMKG